MEEEESPGLRLGRAGHGRLNTYPAQELLKSIAFEFLSINTLQERPAIVTSFNGNLKS